MKLKTKPTAEQIKRSSDPSKITATKNSTKDSVLIESILQNLYQFQSSTSKKLRKEDFIKKEKGRAKTGITVLKTTISNEAETNLKSQLGSSHNQPLGEKTQSKFVIKDLGRSLDSTKKEQDLKHLQTRSDFSKRNLPVGMNNNSNQSTLKTSDVSSSVNDMIEKINILEAEKKQLEHEIFNFKKIIKNHKKEDLGKKIQQLEKEKQTHMNTANHYLNLCSQLAEDVIVLRSQVDKLSHPAPNHNLIQD